MKTPRFGLIRRRSVPVNTRGGGSRLVFKVLVVCRAFVGWMTSTVEALLFEIAMAFYFDLRWVTRQHQAPAKCGFSLFPIPQLGSTAGATHNLSAAKTTGFCLSAFIDQALR
ncbi:MAG: hypothetical protein WCH75_00350 [Candidatus Binatia bacterium]